MGHHVPDPEWSNVDAHGHEHHFEGDELPTLDWVVTDVYWCETCRDEHEEGEWRCRVCGDVVEPRWGWSGEQRFHLPGLAEWILHVNDHEIRLAPEEAAELQSLSAVALQERALRVAAERGVLVW